MKPAELTQTISDTLAKLRKSERKVAKLVLKDPLSIINMRIVDLAKRAEVSEPTVVRFCRAVGCHGFKILNWHWHSNWHPAPVLARLQLQIRLHP